MIETDLSKQIPANEEPWITRRRRLKLYRVTEEVWLDVLAGRIRMKELVAGAVLRNVRVDRGMECLVLKVWSDSFAPVPESERIPYAVSTFEKVV